jgi:hypothetical protein
LSVSTKRLSNIVEAVVVMNTRVVAVVLVVALVVAGVGTGLAVLLSR